jgi:uncharacterized membrane protein YadS
MCSHMTRFSFAPASVRTSSEKRAGVRGAVAVLGLMGATLTSPSHAQQAPSLLTAASFGVLAGSTVTNTGSTVINGNVSYRQFLVTAGPVRRRRLRADGRSAWR